MNDLSLQIRLWISIPLIFIFLGISALFYIGGLAIGVMGTDGCGGDAIPDIVSLYLTIAWPAIMCISSVAPPVLFIMDVKFIWTLLSLFLGIVISSFWYVGWFFIVSYYCGG
jgi:hypothetical protein